MWSCSISRCLPGECINKTDTVYGKKDRGKNSSSLFIFPAQSHWSSPSECINYYRMGIHFKELSIIQLNSTDRESCVCITAQADLTILPASFISFYSLHSILLLHIMYSISFHCRVPLLAIYFHSVLFHSIGESWYLIAAVVAGNFSQHPDWIEDGSEHWHDPKVWWCCVQLLSQVHTHTHTHKGRPLRPTEEFTVEKAQVCHSQREIIAGCKPTDMYWMLSQDHF